MKKLFIALILAAVMAATPVSALLAGGGGIYTNATMFNVTVSDTMIHYNDQVDIILSNASGTSGSGILFTGGLTRSDWADLNFTDISGNVVNFYLWNNSQTATTVNVTIRPNGAISSENNTVILYFGNSSQAASTQNGYSTFIAGGFDDFNGATLNTTQLVQSPSASLSFSGGIVTITSTGGSASTAAQGILTTALFPVNTTMITRTSISTTSTSDLFPGLGYTNILPFPSGSPQNAALHGYYGSTGHGKWFGQSASSSTVTTVESSVTGDNSYHLITVSRIRSASANTSVDRTQITRSATNIPTGNLNASFYAYKGSSSITRNVDWFGVENHSYEATPTTAGFQIYPEISSPIAIFSGTPTAGLESTLQVTFTDGSQNYPTSWLWDFGDGNTTGNTEQNPIHFYTAPGTYSVNLTVSNGAGSSYLLRSSYITVGAATPLAMFTKNYWVVIFPRPIQFTDASTNAPTAWNWSFGDGKYSDSQSPSHQYVKRGRWTVLLNASNSAGYNTNTSTVWILGG